MMNPGLARHLGSDRGIAAYGRHRARRVVGGILAGLTAVALVVVAGPTAAEAKEPKKLQRGRPPSAMPNNVPGGAPENARDDQVSNAAARTTREVAANAEGPKPVVTCDEPVHDFGSVWTGPTLAHTFTVKNTGDRTLNITKVKPSCGCTVAGPYPRSLEPGESGEFPFSINTTKIHSRFDKSVNVDCNDPLTPQLRLRLRGEVKQYVNVVPSNAHFGTIVGDERQERVLNVTNNTDKPLEVTLGDPTSPGFKYELVEKEPGKAFELHVIAEPPFSPGRLQSVVRLNTNIEDQKEITIYARGNVPERIEIQPDSITLSDTHGVQTRGLTRVIRITNYSEQPVKVLDAKIDDPSVTLTLSERTPGKAYTVLVQMPPNYEVPASGRNITITLDDDKTPVATVPIRSQRQEIADRSRRKRPAETLVGTPAPGFTLATLNGSTLTTADLEDHVTVLNFFAPNCGFCKKQIPRLETVRQAYAEKGVRFINVSQKMGNREYAQADVVSIIDTLGFKGDLAINHDNSVGGQFKAVSFPTMIVLGKRGTIDAVNVGNLADLETRMKGQLDALLAGKPIPATADAAGGTDEAPPIARTHEIERKSAGQPTDLIGKDAPKFTTTTIEGKPVSNDELAKYAATVLDFFAPNCGHCKKQIPRLETVRQKYADKPVRFVNVSQTMRKAYEKDEVVKIINDLGFKGELAIDHTNAVGTVFNARGFPTMVVVGRSGKIEAVNVGNVADLESRLSGQLDKLIEGKSLSNATGDARPAADSRTTARLAADTEPKPQQEPQAKRTPTPPSAPSAEGRKPAPPVDLATIDGKPVSNEAFGKYAATVLDFFAPDCGHCKKQIPRLEDIRKKYEDKPVRFVTVSQKMGSKEYSKEEIVAIINGMGFKGELALNHTNSVGQAYGARGFPTMVIVDKNGNVAATNVGNMRDLDERVPAQLDALIAGEAIPSKFAAAAPTRSRRRPAEDLKGTQAPEFTIETVDGKTVSNSDFDKHPATILNFVAANCGYCKRQVPTVEKVRAEYEDKGVRFVNITQTMRNKEYSVEEIVKLYHQDLGTKLEIAKDGKNKIGGLYKAVSFPTLFVVDNEGKIADVIIGAKPDLDKTLRSHLDRLIKADTGT
jgi:thiol-disulfide isomerase/thioredoxin